MTRPTRTPAGALRTNKEWRKFDLSFLLFLPLRLVGYNLYLESGRSNQAGESLPQHDVKDEIVRNWLSASALDLESAKVLYDHRLFASSLYHLQQSNEKLAKGLLLSIGILTPKMAKKDLRVKSILGFQPKQPTSYRHRTLPSLLSDLQKSVPSIEGFLTLLETTELGPRIAEFHETIRKSEKGIQKLKKKPFALIKTTDQLDIEIKGAQAILDAVDQATNKMNQELEKLDLAEAVRIAILLVKKTGFKVDTSQPPSLDRIKAGIVPTLRLTILAALSAAIASLLDPLESVTRYPDSQHDSFDESNPYVMHFKGLYDIVARCIEKSRDEDELLP